jgi:hypothetical protein
MMWIMDLKKQFRRAGFTVTVTLELLDSLASSHQHN